MKKDSLLYISCLYLREYFVLKNSIFQNKDFESPKDFQCSKPSSENQKSLSFSKITTHSNNKINSENIFPLNKECKHKQARKEDTQITSASSPVKKKKTTKKRRNRKNSLGDIVDLCLSDNL